MTFAPLMVRLLERQGFESLPLALAHIAYIWMGFLFLLVCACLVLDLSRLTLTLIGVAFRIGPFAFPARYAFYVALALAVPITVYGLFEATDVRVESFTIRTPKIPEKVGCVRIVQISDVHLGLIVREQRLDKILKRVAEAEPDILVSTGDLVDGQINDLSGFGAAFRRINTRYGKFAVTGNHEYYAGLDRSLSLTEEAGFTVLRGEGVEVLEGLTVVGIDDPAGESFGLLKGVPEQALLSSLPRERFTLLLKHRPLVEERSIGLFDLQLSGHAHKGQIFPFTLMVKPLYPVVEGLLRLQGGSFLYVSRGSGTWGPPIRFLAPPEITVIELIHEGKTPQEKTGIRQGPGQVKAMRKELRVSALYPGHSVYLVSKVRSVSLYPNMSRISWERSTTSLALRPAFT